MRRNHSHASKLIASLTMRRSPTAYAAFVILCTFVACWYTYVLQLHIRLGVELDHGWGGAMQGLELAVRNLKAQELRFTYSQQSPWYYTVLRVELRVVTRHAFAVIVSFITGN